MRNVWLVKPQGRLPEPVVDKKEEKRETSVVGVFVFVCFLFLFFSVGTAYRIKTCTDLTECLCVDVCTLSVCQLMSEHLTEDMSVDVCIAH